MAHPVVHGTNGSTSYETIPPVPLETSGGALSTVDMVVQRRDGPRRLRDRDDGDDETEVNISLLFSPYLVGLHVGYSRTSVGCCRTVRYRL